MIHIFDYYRLSDFLKAVLDARLYTFAELGKSLGLTIPSISIVFNGDERMVIKRMQDWKHAFGFNRMEGEYFELLANIAAYPTSSRQEELRNRAFHIVRRFIQRRNFSDIGYEIFYWLSPECSILSHMIDLVDCPKRTSSIPSWAAGKLKRYRRLKKLSKSKMEERLGDAWDCMKELQAIEWRKKEKRWVRSTPVIQVHRPGGPPTPEIIHALLILPHSEMFAQFSQIPGTEQMVTSYIGTFSLPKVLEPLVEELSREFVEDLISNLVIGCSERKLEICRREEREAYDRVVAYRAKLEKDGKVLPELKDEDFDGVGQIAMALKRVTG